MKGVTHRAFKRMLVEAPIGTPMLATNKLYDPIGLYDCAVVCPICLLTCVFPPTTCIYRSLSLPEKCALFDVRPGF